MPVPITSSIVYKSTINFNTEFILYYMMIFLRVPPFAEYITIGEFYFLYTLFFIVEFGEILNFIKNILDV